MRAVLEYYIIGTGETEMERIELAFALRDLFDELSTQIASIPITVLAPIAGTLLEHVTLILEYVQ